MSDAEKWIKVTAHSWEWDGSSGELPLGDVLAQVQSLPSHAKNIGLLVSAYAGLDYGDACVNNFEVELVYDRPETTEETKARTAMEEKQRALDEALEKRRAMEARMRDMQTLRDLARKYGVTLP